MAEFLNAYRYSRNRVMEQKSLEHGAWNLDFLKLTVLEDRFARQFLLLKIIFMSRDMEKLCKVQSEIL